MVLYLRHQLECLTRVVLFIIWTNADIEWENRLVIRTREFLLNCLISITYVYDILRNGWKGKNRES